MKHLGYIIFTIAACTSFISLGQSYADFTSRSAIDPSLAPFYHGIASGDPTENAVILWTRITADTTGPLTVDWRIADSEDLSTIVNSGTLITDASIDYTVKVDANGLSPNKWYYYEFEYDGIRSITGRTKTASSGDIDSLRFALVSCSNYQAGYFTAYQNITERNDVDAIIHLGDYIYEYETGGYGFTAMVGRGHDPDDEMISLSDYRIRHSWYKLDPDLRKLHQNFPFITIWDDHEFADDAYRDGAGNHQPTEGAWSDRKNAGVQSYLEWMPIRQPDLTDTFRVYRNLKYGDLVDFIVVDTRIYDRDKQVSVFSAMIDDTTRYLLGPDQLDWVKDQLSNSTARWKVLVNQVMVAPLEALGIPLNSDQWDGYAAERQRLYDHILADSIRNLVVLTGDIHTSWANDLPYGDTYNSNTGQGSVGVEFVCTSVTSPGFPISYGVSAIQLFNDHIKYIDLTKHGYQILDLNKTRTQSDYWFVNTIKEPVSADYPGTGWMVENGKRFLKGAPGPSVRYTPNPPLVAPGPPSVVCNTPLNPLTSAVTETSAVLSWDIVPFASQYILQGKVTGTPGSKFLPLIITPAIFSSFNPSTTYEWRLASDCGAAGLSVPTVWQSFTTNTMRIQSNDLLNLNWVLPTLNNTDISKPQIVILGMYPNPFIDRFGLKYFNSTVGEIPVKLFDIQGRLYFEGQLDGQTAGVHFQSINFESGLKSELTAGMYILVIGEGNNKVSRRIEKISN
ncbi:MAG: alkaline phosphatase D [Limisphaerales bacterium]|jgi:alkaline phosphatase D